ncbi:hypothetical protein [Parabacteroides sp. PF5-6]|uniref:hypothetical protein n=1 Tax=Parabacteroides sp. PF5-6 TaxID=1742403 RepID=UPI002406CA21|nr:hypothetical protein [Parabacteroides sp. PF5-6]MDF9830525.1 hypothetical protein [Parabacteroides sp. PF5-6]
MNDKHIDELIDRALREEQELPQGLSDRLEQYIDQLAAEDHQKQAKRVKMRTLYWMTGVAASLLLGIALFFPTESFNPRPTTADTFKSPEEAAAAAQEALAFLSLQLNKGLDQVSDAKGEVEKVNEIVNKQIKEVDTP